MKVRRVGQRNYCTCSHPVALSSAENPGERAFHLVPSPLVGLQGRLAAEQKESLVLDSARRKFYKKTQKHLKKTMQSADTGDAMSMPEDSELQSARSTGTSAVPTFGSCCFAVA